MSSFKEFLEDYEARELNEINRFIKRLDEGKVSLDETYPPKERFIKLKEPVADPYCSIWGIVPFFGSTFSKLIPRDDKKSFDEINKHSGLNSCNINEMIDFVKETGRIQFVTTANPTSYKKLEFLEPLFCELKPPVLRSDVVSLIGYEADRRNRIEFDTLAKLGFNRYIEYLTRDSGNNNTAYIETRVNDYADRYIVLKILGYEDLADEIGILMIINPPEAKKYLAIFGSLITSPQRSLFKCVYSFDRKLLTEANELSKPFGINIHENIPCEIGKFLLNKIVLYPETLDGCRRVIQEYDDYELYKVLGALNKGIKRKNIDIIEDKKVDASEILDNVWKDADKIRLGSEGISFGASLDIGLIGELAAGLPGTGLLAGLGFQAVDRFWGIKSESISEKIAKFVSPNYLVTVYDFKKKHALTD